MITDLSITPYMYVYSAENVLYSDDTQIYVDTLKVSIPDIFLDKGKDKAFDLKIGTEDRNIFINKVKPSLSNNIVSSNYLEIPLLNPIRINSPNDNIHVGDKFICSFMYNDPTEAFILSRSVTR